MSQRSWGSLGAFSIYLLWLHCSFDSPISLPPSLSSSRRPSQVILFFFAPLLCSQLIAFLDAPQTASPRESSEIRRSAGSRLEREFRVP